MAKGNFYFNGGAYDLTKAAEYYKVAAFVDGKASSPHYQLARVFFEKGEFDPARIEINKALVLNPANGRSFYIRGLIDGYAKNWKASEDDFQKFIAYAPSEWAGYNDLAWAYHEDNDYQNAVDAAKKGLEQFPNNPWLLNGLGAAYLGLGDKENAKIALEKAKELADNLTASDWAHSYPGNDPANAPWDLAKFKTDLNSNLSSAGNQLAASSPGIFQAACCSAADGNCTRYCSGNTCVADEGDSQLCDPTHVSFPTGWWGHDGPGHPTGYCPWGTTLHSCIDFVKCKYNYDWKTCTSDADCCTVTGWTPSCGVTDCYTAPGVCDASLRDNTCPGVTQTSNCGTTRCVALPTCGLNQAPTVAIVSPTVLPATFDPSATYFSINVKDQDSDKITVTASTLTCPSTVHPLLGKDTGTADTSVQQNINATVGGLTAGVSCLWTVTISDGTHSVSDNVTFQTKPASSPTSCICGSQNGRPACGTKLDGTETDLCSTGSVSHFIADQPFAYTWDCTGSCSLVPCSASKSCGWIETNP